MSARHLKQEERDLLVAMLARKPTGEAIIARLSDYLVQDLGDGGMGSVRVVGSEDRRFGGQIATVDLRDVDGVPLSITVNIDNFGELFEIDIWKVDFSPLKQYPRVS